MINLNNLNRQHGTIREEINVIENEIAKGSSFMNTAEIALHINKLAGQLKIHLLEEDKFLYPDLVNCSDKEIQAMAYLYLKEMGDLADEFTKFKNEYNVGSKINSKMDAFLRDSRKVLEVLAKRVTKEKNELYHLIEMRGL